MRRELPTFESFVLGPKLNKYAIVIPVINEGERIQRQILGIKALALDADVIIADGGSVDNSLNIPFLQEGGVRVLLTKTGSGKLGAQLRMAYAWCLDEGYSGLVTVDGNGKDGLEGIKTIIAKLSEGYGYVQGSRYMQGGKAINTPLDRKIAGRLIHSPLLSFAGRRWFTDTTNGFRGYSAEYLSDPRVDPFRDVFSKYALLFYLTVRAGQLGYSTCQVPVSRSYPSKGTTPTKIAGLRGRADMMRELLDVVLKRYHPNQ
jgi:glycosyltransferase involved in cell wall biosynthesis